MPTNVTVAADIAGRQVTTLIDLPNHLFILADALADNDPEGSDGTFT